MKKIEWQEPLELTTIKGDPIPMGEETATLEFEDFLLERLLDPTFGKDMKSILAAVSLRDAIREGPDELGHLWLESSDWTLLCKATEAPQGGYNAGVSHNLPPYIRAVTLAKDGKPNGAAKKTTKKKTTTGRLSVRK